MESVEQEPASPYHMLEQGKAIVMHIITFTDF